MTVGCPNCGFQFEPPAPAALTRRQRALLLFIRKYQTENGIAPSFAEMVMALELNSKSAVHRLVNGLADRGAIRHERFRPRSIAITQAGLSVIDDLRAAALGSH